VIGAHLSLMPRGTRAGAGLSAAPSVAVSAPGHAWRGACHLPFLRGALARWAGVLEAAAATRAAATAAPALRAVTTPAPAPQAAVARVAVARPTWAAKARGLAAPARFSGGPCHLPPLLWSHALDRGRYRSRCDRPPPRQTRPGSSTSTDQAHSDQAAPSRVPQGLSDADPSLRRVRDVLPASHCCASWTRHAPAKTNAWARAAASTYTPRLLSHRATALGSSASAATSAARPLRKSASKKGQLASSGTR